MNDLEIMHLDATPPHKCHDWRNYLTNELREAWPTIEPRVRKMIAKMCDDLADREEWE